MEYPEIHNCGDGRGKLNLMMVMVRLAVFVNVCAQENEAFVDDGRADEAPLKCRAAYRPRRSSGCRLRSDGGRSSALRKTRSTARPQYGGTNARTHERTNAQTHERTHARMHACTKSPQLRLN
eukprot:6202838-Pleurochrysis_carterae.AAC.1